MCDGTSRPVKAARAVSIRELGRAIASIVGEVELDGSVVVLSRRGRMVALLTPLPERTIVEITSAPRHLEDELEDAGESPANAIDLDPMAKAMLASARAAYPMPFSLGGFIHESGCGVAAAAVAFNRLEQEGLVENDMRGRRLTRRGLAAARWLDSSKAGGQ